MFFGLWRSKSKKKKLVPLKPPGGGLTRFEYCFIVLVGFGCSYYTWYPLLVPNPDQIERQKMKPKPKLEGILPNDELKKLKSSWKVADKIALAKYLVTSPGTKFIATSLFKATVILGGIGYSIKMLFDSQHAEQRAAGLFLSDLEERKLTESQRQKY